MQKNNRPRPKVAVILTDSIWANHFVVLPSMFIIAENLILSTVSKLVGKTASLFFRVKIRYKSVVLYSILFIMRMIRHG